MVADSLATQLIISVIDGSACSYRVWIGDDADSVFIGFVQNQLADVGPPYASAGEKISFFK
jgi:hypothetical protein